VHGLILSARPASLPDENQTRFSTEAQGPALSCSVQPG
jgi:hypothetical protein